MFTKHLINLYKKTFRHPIDEHQKKRKICFIISAPRSGSTWLKTALNFHPQVYCTENRFFGHFFENWPNANGTFSPRITLDKYVGLFSEFGEYKSLGYSKDVYYEKILTELLNSLIDFYHRVSGKSIIVDKITPYINTSESVIKSIKKYFPSASVIQLVRDGRDVLTSGVFDWIQRESKEKKRYQIFVENKSNTTLNRFFEDPDIDLWTRYWTEPIQAIDNSGICSMAIKYEDMLLNQQAELIRIFKLLEVGTEEKIIKDCVSQASFENMSGGRKHGEQNLLEKVRKGVKGDWQNYFTRRDGNLFHQKAGKYLLSMGYENDDNWSRCLPVELA